MGRVTPDIIDELMFEDSLCARAAAEIERLRTEVLKLHAHILRTELEEIHAREARNVAHVRQSAAVEAGVNQDRHTREDNDGK